jgi:hypothetical protein
MRKTCLLSIGCLALLAGFAQAQVPNLNTQEIQQLRAECVAQQSAIATQRVESTRRLIDEQVESARQSVNRAKLSGNITAQAGALSALRIFEEVKASFAKDGSCAVPGPIRRDLETTIENFKRNLQVIEDKQTSARKALRRGCGEKLADLLSRQQTPVADEDKRLELVDQLLGSPAVSSPADTHSTPSSNRVTNAAGAAGHAQSTVLGATGESANWTPLVRLEIQVRDAVEIVSIPLTGLNQAKTFQGAGAMGNPWRALATPFQELAAGDKPAPFRAQSIPPLKPVEILTWPSPRNRWNLEVRTRAELIPSSHGLILETDPSAFASPGGTAKTASSPVETVPAGSNRPAAVARPPVVLPVRVRFESAPDGAYVIAGSQPLVAAENKPLLTPFDCLMPPVPVDIRFKKRGYRESALAQTTPSANAVYRVKLVELPGFADVSLSVSANATDWTLSGVRAKRDARVRVAATGEWTCGAGREPIDADGYPRNETFNKYYQDPAQNPRLLGSANYGQLLARILPGGEPVAVGRQGTLTASMDGEVALAINEAPLGRRDNKGKIDVRITIDP